MAVPNPDSPGGRGSGASSARSGSGRSFLGIRKLRAPGQRAHVEPKGTGRCRRQKRCHMWCSPWRTHSASSCTPSSPPETFRELETNTRGMSGVHLLNAGLGSNSGTEVLIENDRTDMTSFLEPDTAAWGTVVRDEFCADRSVDHIDP